MLCKISIKTKTTIFTLKIFSMPGVYMNIYSKVKLYNNLFPPKVVVCLLAYSILIVVLLFYCVFVHYKINGTICELSLCPFSCFGIVMTLCIISLQVIDLAWFM